MRLIYLALVLLSGLASHAQTTTLRNYRLSWDDSIKQNVLLDLVTGDQKILRVQWPRPAGNFFILDSFIVIRNSDMRSLFDLKGNEVIPNACYISTERDELVVKMCNRNVYHLNRRGKIIKSYGNSYHGGPLLDSNLISEGATVYVGPTKAKGRYDLILNKMVTNFVYLEDLPDTGTVTFKLVLHNRTGGKIYTSIHANPSWMDLNVLDTTRFIEPYYPLTVEVTVKRSDLNSSISIPYYVNRKRSTTWVYLFTKVLDRQRFIEINYEGDKGDRNRMTDTTNGYRLYVYYATEMNVNNLKSTIHTYVNEQCNVTLSQGGRYIPVVRRRDYAGKYYHEIIPEPNKPFTLIVQHKDRGESTHYFDLDWFQKNRPTQSVFVEIDQYPWFVFPGKN